MQPAPVVVDVVLAAVVPPMPVAVVAPVVDVVPL
jgi:hypothetical protein